MHAPTTGDPLKNAFLLAAVLLSGCNLKYHAFPGATPGTPGFRFASVDYQIMGATTAEACGTYIIGIDFGHLFVDQEGSASGGGGGSPIDAILAMAGVGGADAEVKRATYDALEKMPEASHLIPIKVHETVTGIAPFGFPLFGQRCAEIEARGLKIGRGPVPNAD
jgi:hypothetical protein